MARSFDEIEKALAAHAKLAKVSRERVDALASAANQAEPTVTPRADVPSVPSALPLTQPKR